MVGGDPASRLRSLLLAARDTNAGLLREGWATLLDVEVTDRATLLSRVGDVVALPNQIRAAIQDVAPDHEELTDRLPEIEAALSMLNLDGQKWNDFRTRYSDAALDQLRYVSRELRRYGTYPSTTREELDKLRQQAQDLIEDVLQADLDSELRDYLLRHLQRVREALERFRVLGPEAVDDAIRQATGDLHLRPDLDDKRGHPLAKSFGALLAAVSLLSSTVNNTLGAAERIQHMLGRGEAAPVVEVVVTDDDED